MRLFPAVLAMFSLTSLMFVQGGLVCALRVGHAPEAVVSGGHGAHQGHEGHVASGGTDVARSAPDTDPAPAPVCLTMGPCALALDVSPADLATPTATRADRVIGVSVYPPRSQVTAPELPPPRA